MEFTLSPHGHELANDGAACAVDCAACLWGKLYSAKAPEPVRPKRKRLILAMGGGVLALNGLPGVGELLSRLIQLGNDEQHPLGQRTALEYK